ncbi:MAG: AMP-binding protein [Clostridia bacterium]|nr:AMP-binding protein [Clostridia bacterium]
MKKVKELEAIEFNNIKEIIYNSAKKYNEKTAFIIKNKKGKEISYTNVSYMDFLDDVNNYGTGLYAMGLKGKRIAIVGKNRYEWVLSYISNMLGRIVSVPLDKDLQLEELENSLVRSKADAIVFDPKLLKEVEQIKQNNKTQIKEYICMDSIEGYKNVHEIKEQGKEKLKQGYTDFKDCKIDEKEMSILLFTSGTTSKSKAVMLCQKNIASNIYAMQCVEDVRSTDTNMAFLPLHHIFGSVGLLMMLACGVTTAFPDGLRYVKQNMQEYKVSIFVVVPLLTEAIYKAVLKEIDRQGKTKLINVVIKVSNLLRKLHIDIRRKLFKQVLEGLGGELRLIISGGAAADPEVIKGFSNFGVETVQGYGLSETGPVIAAENYFYQRPGSVGKTLKNVKVEIANKDEKGIGEIKVKGPNIMLGYYEMEDLTKESIRDGWFYTGDLGYFDNEGFLFISGRNKNLIVLKNGKKVFPEELETLINRLELVSECMVFGMPNENDKNDVKLSVKVVYDDEIIKEKYSKNSDDELYDALWNEIKEINATFPRYKHVKNLIVSHEELIKTTTKKVKRFEELERILKTSK